MDGGTQTHEASFSLNVVVKPELDIESKDPVELEKERKQLASKRETEWLRREQELLEASREAAERFSLTAEDWEPIGTKTPTSVDGEQDTSTTVTDFGSEEKSLTQNKSVKVACDTRKGKVAALKEEKQRLREERKKKLEELKVQRKRREEESKIQRKKERLEQVVQLGIHVSCHNKNKR